MILNRKRRIKELEEKLLRSYLDYQNLQGRLARFYDEINTLPYPVLRKEFILDRLMDVRYPINSPVGEDSP